MKHILLFLIPMVLLTCKAITAQQQQQLSQKINEREPVTFSVPRVFEYNNLKDTSNLKNVYSGLSKNQKITGWILLGGGTVMGVVGTIMFSENFEIFSDGNDAAANTGGAFMLIGVGAALGSVPFFISSARNARRAAKLSISNQEILLSRHPGIARKIQQAFTLAVTLK
jgi:hypothetical protein